MSEDWDSKRHQMMFGNTDDTKAGDSISMQAIVSGNIQIVLEKMHKYIGVGDSKRSKLWADRLAREDYSVADVREAADKVVTSWKDTRPPPFAVFKDFLPSKMEFQEDPRQHEYAESEYFMEETRNRMVLHKEKLGADPEDHVGNWFRAVYGADSETWLPVNTFIPIYLQDMEEADWDFDKAVEIGRGRC